MERHLLSRIWSKITRKDFLSWVYAEAFRKFPEIKLPHYAFLVGHFTRADLTAFADFKDFRHCLNAVRNSFITLSFSPKGNALELHAKSGEPTRKVYIPLRDSMLLCPSGKQSLRDLGDLLELNKIHLTSEDDIKRMDLLLIRDRELYERYALRDAEICSLYALKIIQLHKKIGLPRVIPPTLGTIGVSYLLKIWKQKDPNYKLEVLGQEIVTDKPWTPKGRRERKKVVAKHDRYCNEAFVTECYHGGRNEQYFFGPAPEGDWRDFDLSSAYPTAMSLITEPNWEGMEVVKNFDITKAKITDLSYFFVEFNFPQTVRFPVLPVRTPYGLIFPLKGECYCSSPELILAHNLGATFKIKGAVCLPALSKTPVFKPFIKDCLHRRGTSENKLEELFWKEIANSTYGKTAQGLRKKRVFECRSEDTVELPPSKVTNPFFAAYVTSFVRATLGEIMNQLPSGIIISNCTTDGFLCNATQEQVKSAAKGPICQIYAEARKALTLETSDSQAFIEVKHRIRQPLGWRTRGQATLQRSSDTDDNIVIAKAGLKAPRHCDSDEKQNDWIIEQFLSRETTTMYNVESLTGIRDIVSNGFDLVPKTIKRRLRMEYDWKRVPAGIMTNPIRDTFHVYFETSPIGTVKEFMEFRDCWDDYNRTQGHILKTEENVKQFLDYKSNRVISKGNGNVSKSESSTKVFKMEVLTAIQKKKSLSLTNQELADWLTKRNFKTSRADVENARRRKLRPNRIIRTPMLEALMEDIKTSLVPSLDEKELWAN